MKPVKVNLIKGEELSSRIREVLNTVADIIGETIGPYGKNILSHSVNTITSTKDGWNSIQDITFESTLDNAIKSMIANVALNAVLHAGDGTSTSTYVSNQINNMLLKPSDKTGLSIMDTYTIREIEDSLCRCVSTIIGRLTDKAETITEDNMETAIRNIALVSTNWNTEISDIIADIFTKTHNPIIKVLKSGTDKTFHEIIDGFDLAGRLLLPDYYLTDRTAMKCEIENPTILVFNGRVTDSMFVQLVDLANVIRSNGGTLVIMSHQYDEAFLKRMISLNHELSKQCRPYIPMIPVSIHKKYVIDKECIDDFCVLVGAVAISNHDTSFEEMVNDLQAVLHGPVDPESNPDHDREYKEQILRAAVHHTSTIGGTCEKISISSNGVIVTGLTNANMDMINHRKEQLKSEIQIKTNEYDAMSMLTDSIREKRIRLGKLQCKMGIVYVGGYGDGNIKARSDALDDAIRACECAYYNGYVTGSGLSVIQAIRNIEDDGGLSELDTIIYDTIRTGYTNLFLLLFINKYKTKTCTVSDIANTKRYTKHELTFNEVLSTCVANDCGFDIVGETIDRDHKIICPLDVDISVLKGCLRLVLLCITSNQLLFKNYDELNTVSKDSEVTSSVSPIK